jgi:expansin (peptidoglycan-binding protein)
VKQGIWILLALTLLPSVGAPARAAGPPQPSANLSTYLPLVQKASPRTVVPGLPFDPFASYSGQATTYTYTSGGACTRDPIPAGTLVGAINAPQFYNSLLCGAYLTVTGPAGTAQVLIVDLCPGCPAGDLDLDTPAFQAITGATDGRYPITWQLTSPPLSGPIGYRFQGSNPFYVKVQVIDHRNPVYSIELDTGGGNFVPLTRTADGFFEYNPGSALGSLRLRVTDIYNNRLIDSGIPIASNSQQVFVGHAQFPAAP